MKEGVYRIEKTDAGGIIIWFGEGSQVILTKQMLKEIIEEHLL